MNICPHCGKEIYSDYCTYCAKSIHDEPDSSTDNFTLFGDVNYTGLFSSTSDYSTDANDEAEKLQSDKEYQDILDSISAKSAVKPTESKFETVENLNESQKSKKPPKKKRKSKLISDPEDFKNFRRDHSPEINPPKWKQPSPEIHNPAQEGMDFIKGLFNEGDDFKTSSFNSNSSSSTSSTKFETTEKLRQQSRTWNTTTTSNQNKKAPDKKGGGCGLGTIIFIIIIVLNIMKAFFE